MSEDTLITGDTALAKVLGVNMSRVRGWRLSGAIPYSRTGRRGILYWKNEVIAALRAARVTEKSEVAA